MSLPTIIGLSGKAGCGKDTLGRMALRPLGYSQFSLAWAMKNEAVGGIEGGPCYACTRGDEFEQCTCFEPYILKPTYEDVHFNKPPEIRAFLQERGTENGWMKYGKDYWCRIADAWMRTLRENCGLDRFYVPDVRFPHEVEWIQAQGGMVIRIVGRGGLIGGAANHPSETALDGEVFVNVVNNSGAIEDSIEAMQKIVRTAWVNS